MALAVECLDQRIGGRTPLLAILRRKVRWGGGSNCIWRVHSSSFVDASPRCDVESFRDRADAGGFEPLSIVVAEDVMVLCWGLPSKAPNLSARLDVFAARELGFPEFASGSVKLARCTPCRGARPLFHPTTEILVDNWFAAVATKRTTARVRRRRPARIVVAIPATVGIELQPNYADKSSCVTTPTPFSGGVASYWASSPQNSAEDVRSSSGAPRPPKTKSHTPASPWRQQSKLTAGS